MNDSAAAKRGGTMKVNVEFRMGSLEQEEQMRRRLTRLAGRGASSSGYCFQTGRRDLDYPFKDSRKAKSFVRAAKRIRGVRATLWAS